MKLRRIACMLLAAALWLPAGCAPQPTPSPSSPTAPPTETAVPPVTFTPQPTEPTAAVETATPLPSPTIAPPAKACSPLKGFELADLDDPDLLKGTFAPPRPGYDDGHFGLDFSYWADDQGQPMLGLPVLAVLAGRVAASLPDRQPYGNAVIIETPLDQLPLTWRAQIPAASDLTFQPAISLNCPEYAYTPPSTERSLYIIYGHFNMPSELKIGQEVACGDAIGEVGTTGRSVNPHLHLEMRVGASGMDFPVMGHYTNDATEEERRLYCVWRVSGAFQALDPLPLLLPED